MRHGPSRLTTVVLVIATLAVLAAVAEALVLASRGQSGATEQPGATFAAGKVAGLNATAKAIEEASPYGAYYGIAVVSLAPTYCARYDPTPMSGVTDNPNTLNEGTPWYLGCIAGIDAHASQLGDTGQ